MFASLATTIRSATDRRFRQFAAQRRIVGHEERQMAGGGRAPADGPLLRDGIAFLPELIDAEQIAEVQAHFAGKFARDPYRRIPPFRGDAIPMDTHVAHYSDRDIVDAPHLLGIANDPSVLEMVEAYLGGPPVLSAMRVWWSSPTPGGQPEHAERFHRDFDDLRFVKLFVYLTDVDEEAGPHLYIRGSHRIDRLTGIGRYSDEQVEAAFDRKDFMTITGQAGTAFLESTYGVHRGIPPRSKPRLIFQPLYTLAPTIYGPRKPLRDYRPEDGAVDFGVSRIFLSQPSSARRK